MTAPAEGTTFAAMLKVLTHPEPAGYDDDFAEWAWAQARLLREKRFSELDLENLIDEVEGLPKSDRRALESNVRVVLMHLLKWRHQPSHRSLSWTRSIAEHRSRIRYIARDSPSLRARLSEIFAGEYTLARAEAAEETGIPYEQLPDVCPFSLEQTLDVTYLPEAVEEA